MAVLYAGMGATVPTPAFLVARKSATPRNKKLKTEKKVY